jgi:hypothetical protein
MDLYPEYSQGKATITSRCNTREEKKRDVGSEVISFFG